MGIRAQGNALASFLDVWSKTGLDAVTPEPPPVYIEATGGTTSDYTDPGPGNVYRAHIFEASGAFNVTQVGAHGGPTTVEYLVVAGGGGGGGYSGGAGGAGGLLASPNFAPPTTNQGGAMPVSATTYPISVGGGGAEAHLRVIELPHQQWMVVEGIQVPLIL